MNKRPYPKWYNNRPPRSLAEFNEIWRYIASVERRLILLDEQVRYNAR